MPAIAGRIDTVDVTIAAESGAMVETTNAVDGAAPNCLPFSFSVLGETVAEGEPITTEVRGVADGDVVFTKTVRAEIGSGLQLLSVELDDLCVRSGCAENDVGVLPTIERERAEQILAKTCLPPPPEPAACLEGGGCFDEAGEACVTPCPTSEPVEPAAPPAPTEPPDPPVVDDCPPGWSLVDDGVARCEPWPIDGFVACPADAIRTPGTGCVRLGAECVGAWPADLPADAIYVSPRGTGNGTRGAPFGSIDAAFVRAVDGQTIALAEGTYSTTTLLLDTAVRIVGCGAGSGITAMRTIVVGANVELAAVRVSALRVDRALTANGVRFTSGLDVAGRATLDVVDLVAGADVSGTLTASAAFAGGTIATTGTLVLQDFTVRDVDGPGIDASAGDVTLRGGVIEGVRSAAVRLSGGADFDGARLVLRDVAATGANGEGLIARSGGAVDLEKTWIERVQRHGVHVDDSPPATVTDVGVRDVRPVAEEYGEGVRVVGGAMRLERISIADVHSTGVATNRASLTASHVFVENVRENDERARGLRVYLSTLEADHLQFDDCERGAVRVSPASTATIAHMLVNRTDTRYGIYIEPGAHVLLENAEINEPGWSGVRVEAGADAASTVTVRDVRVNDPGTSGVSIGQSGEHQQAIVSLRRVAVRDADRFGIYARETELDMRDIRIEGTRNIDMVTTAGGVFADTRAFITGSHVELEDNEEAGLVVVGGEVDLSHVVIKASVCESSQTCGFSGSGMLVNVGRVDLDHFILDTNVTYGLQSRLGAPIDFVHGEVRGHAVGLFLNPLAADLVRYARRVRFIDNGVDVLVE